ncbi:hypothetical protein [Brevundimonas sp. FT23042]|uniref:hypothetical protein n=1 Tax=Brevundimonas sp. FT23042 TaxID=3393749 RepID=UPI003B587788
MSITRSLSILAALGAASTLAACATAPTGPVAPAGPAPFNASDFNWSTASGRASIEGRIDFRREGQTYACTGSVALTPDTPYTRARFRTLYGSTDRAAVPEAVVRARTVADPNADYRGFVRSATCSDGRFMFNGLPSGGWFIIAPVSAGGDRVVLMRRVDTRNGRIAVTLP